MNSPVKRQLIHIGPIRQESEALLKHTALPSLVITPMPEWTTIKSMQDDLKQVSAAVASQAGEATRYSYNVPGFNSLTPATGLKLLYPGVAETQRKTVETQPLNELINEHCPPGTLMTHLVLEQPEQALSLLQAWQEEGMLDNLEELFVRASPISLYDGMPTQAELTAWCQQHGFDTGSEKIDRDSSEDPEFILLEFKRNTLHAPLKAAQDKVDTLKQECDSLQKKLTEYEKLLKEKAQQLSESAAALRETDAQLKQQLSEKESTITQLREELASQLQNQEISQSRFEALESKLEGKLESLLGQQRSYIQQTSNALGQHVTRLAHKQRDERALNHYLHHGQKLVSTELDPAYALALLEQYHSQRYDVVMVFGNAATTELLAKANVNSHASQPQSILERKTNDLVTPSENDLPTSIISIEHQKGQCAETIKMLEASNCRQVVNIVHAPWIEFEYQEKVTLFYGAEDTLKMLSQCLSVDARVMVIISPEIAKANHGSHAGLLQLLQHLPTQAFEIILENLDSHLEREFINDWNFLLDTRQREGEWFSLPSALLLQVKE